MKGFTIKYQEGKDLEDHTTFEGVLSQAIDPLKGDVEKGASSVLWLRTDTVGPLSCSRTDVCSARQSACGLAERAFLNIPHGLLLCLHMGYMERKFLDLLPIVQQSHEVFFGVGKVKLKRENVGNPTINP